jgi:undecaprenyl-diphosphatase
MPFTRKTLKLFCVLLLVALAANSVMMLTIAEVHEHIYGARLLRMDERVQGDVHDDATPGLTRLMFALTWIGSPQVLVPAIPLLAAVLWWRGLRRAPLVWLAATGGAGVLVVLLKLHFRRLRPDLPWAFVHEPSYSFPSGHSVLAVVVYGSLIFLGMRHLRSLWARTGMCIVAGGLIMGIGISRIYLGVHYPSDVAAGYFVGTVWLGAVVAADWYVRRVERSSNPTDAR